LKRARTISSSVMGKRSRRLKTSPKTCSKPRAVSWTSWRRWLARRRLHQHRHCRVSKGSVQRSRLWELRSKATRSMERLSIRSFKISNPTSRRRNKLCQYLPCRPSGASRLISLRYSSVNHSGNNPAKDSGSNSHNLLGSSLVKPQIPCPSI
jgi:hypothetical protein